MPAFDLSRILRDLENPSPGTPLDDFISELGKQLMSAQAQAGAAGTQLQQAVNAPAPRVDPLGEALVRSMGLASEGFTGRQGAFREAQGLVGGAQETLNQRRLESLQQLQQAYKNAADRAAKIGDNMAEMKFKKLLDTSLAKEKQLHDEAMLSKETTAAGQRTALQVAGGIEEARIGARSRLQVAAMEAGGRLSSLTAKFPPELEAALTPTVERLKQLSQARGQVLSDPKLDEGQRKTRTREIEAEFEPLQEQYVETIKQYFQQPSGDSGEALQTPLGAIMKRARDGGVQTFEQFKQAAVGHTSSALLKGYDLKKTLAAASIDVPGAGFPKQAEVNKRVREYKMLTGQTGMSSKLMFGSIVQNRRKIDELAEWLNARGFEAKTSDELLNPAMPTLPETVVR